jgi:hypothetical protein
VNDASPPFDADDDRLDRPISDSFDATSLVVALLIAAAVIRYVGPFVHVWV